VRDLEFYFRGRIREVNSVMREARIVVGLRKVEAVRMQAGLLLGEGIPGANGGRGRRVRIDDERVCGVCYKRLGGSVISVFPEYVVRNFPPEVVLLLTCHSNSVVHLGCANRRQAEPAKA
jgi:Vam6/Vps39-like protein vacuolar protein sorting-associated protein 39